MQKARERVEWDFSFAVSSCLFKHLQIWLDLPIEMFRPALSFHRSQYSALWAKGSLGRNRF